MTSHPGAGNLGVGEQQGGDFEHARVQSADARSGTTQWTAVQSADKTYITLRNTASVDKCLAASAELGSAAYLTDCVNASKFRLAMTSAVNYGRFVSIDSVGYCLEDRGASGGYSSVLLVRCGTEGGQTFAMSGPTATNDPNRNWARKLGLALEFARCNRVPAACVYTPDDPSAPPVLEVQSAGCLKVKVDPDDGSAGKVLKAVYTESEQSSRKLGSSEDVTTGVEIMWEGNGVTSTFGTNAYQNNTYTHVATDTSAYSVWVPDKMHGWFMDTEYTGKTTGVPLIRSADASSIAGVADLPTTTKSTPADGKTSASHSDGSHRPWLLGSSIGLGLLAVLAAGAVYLRQRRTPGRRRRPNSHSPS